MNNMKYWAFTLRNSKCSKKISVEDNLTFKRTKKLKEEIEATGLAYICQRQQNSNITYLELNKYITI